MYCAAHFQFEVGPSLILRINQLELLCWYQPVFLLFIDRNFSSLKRSSVLGDLNNGLQIHVFLLKEGIGPAALILQGSCQKREPLGPTTLPNELESAFKQGFSLIWIHNFE